MSTNECNICKKSSFEEIISLKDGYMSDGTKMHYPLRKIECSCCGTVRSKNSFDWINFYKNEYSPGRNVDAIAIDRNNIEISRSRFIYDWIVLLLKKSGYEVFSSVFEIGCGQGYLLNKFSVENKFGIELSKDAYQIACNYASVRNIGFEDINSNEKYDLVLSYCVIEHVEYPSAFLEKAFKILSDDGIMLVALPIQDKFNYDLFFMDHIYHFSHLNFIKLLGLNNFEVLNFELGRDSYSNIGMYVCKKKSDTVSHEVFQFIKNKNIFNVNLILENINKIISQKNESLYAFGYGEIAKTIIPYTAMDSLIKYYIDDTCNAEKVISSLKAKTILNKEAKVTIILLVNPNHEDKIKSIFSDLNNIRFINIFDGIDVS